MMRYAPASFLFSDSNPSIGWNVRENSSTGSLQSFQRYFRFSKIKKDFKSSKEVSAEQAQGPYYSTRFFNFSDEPINVFFLNFFLITLMLWTFKWRPSQCKNLSLFLFFLWFCKKRIFFSFLKIQFFHEDKKRTEEHKILEILKYFYTGGLVKSKT